MTNHEKYRIDELIKDGLTLREICVQLRMHLSTLKKYLGITDILDEEKNSYKGFNYFFVRGSYRIQYYPAIALATRKAVETVINTYLKSKIV